MTKIAAASKSTDAAKTIDIYGLGNALVDFLVEVDDALLGELRLTKGRFHLTDAAHSRKILERITYANVRIAAGGSAANATAMAALLGAKTAFCGKLGDDEYGHLYEQETLAAGAVSKLSTSRELTGHCIVLITPDAERTFAVHYGASTRMGAHDISEDDIRSSRLIHLDGYFLEDEKTREPALHALRLAKKHRTKVSLDLSDAGVVERSKAFFISSIKQHADIVFANEQEAEALTGKKAEEAATELAQWCETAIVKRGVHGSLIARGKELIRVSAVKAHAVDTTGAGDAYAAGFLYGLLKGWPLKDAGELASALAAKVVEQVGARLAPGALDDATFSHKRQSGYSSS